MSCCKLIWTFTFLIKNVINTGIVLFKTLQSIQICQLTQNVRFEIHNIHTCSFYINNADTFLWVTFTVTHDEIKTKSGQACKTAVWNHTTNCSNFSKLNSFSLQCCWHATFCTNHKNPRPHNPHKTFSYHWSWLKYPTTHYTQRHRISVENLWKRFGPHSSFETDQLTNQPSGDPYITPF